MSTMTAVKERPILFSAPMVRAILSGAKTQTRRVIKPQPEGFWGSGQPPLYGGVLQCIVSKDGAVRDEYIFCPYGVPGDRLWVREAFLLEDNREYFGDAEFAPPQDGRPIHHHARANEYDREYNLIPRYRATESDFALECEHEDCNEALGPCMHPWRPSIHMPRWASRITLELTNVCVQRVQEISEEDACAEGVVNWGRQDGEPWDHWRVMGTRIEEDSPVPCYEQLWDSINADRGFGWEKNPWVWALTFRRLP